MKTLGAGLMIQAPSASHRTVQIRPSASVLAWSGLVAVTVASGLARGEALVKDTSAEISVSSAMRNFRSCTVAFIPKQTLGEALSPRVAFVTSGLSNLHFGLDDAIKFQDPVIVQNNVRRPLAASANVSSEQFLATDLAKVLRSHRPFFVTAKRIDTGKFVSSRYEGLDFDAILGQVETNCPFDAEALMSDVSARERTERSLDVSEVDLRLIRWVLNKKYGNFSSEPERRLTLSPAERDYLKRYGADNGLPASRFLTAESVRKLIAEGSNIATLAVPPPSPKRWNSVAGGIWKVRGKVHVAIGYSAPRNSAAEAESIAVEKCRQAGGENCKSAGVWDYGCIYITLGTNTRGAGWAARASAEEALKACRANGYSCRVPIGGCVD